MIPFGPGHLVDEVHPTTRCCGCGETFTREDRGMVVPAIGGVHKLQAFHEECLLRSVVGGVNHQQSRCTCCGGSEPPDPPGLTRREAARVAASYFRQQRLKQS